MTFLLSLEEIAEQLGKSTAASKMWLSRHGLRAVRRVSVGERATRALYDGLAVRRHAERAVAECTGCTSRARVTLIASGTAVSATSQPSPT